VRAPGPSADQTSIACRARFDIANSRRAQPRGGGGAFLHPTHHLPDSISAIWVGTTQTLRLGKNTTSPQPAAQGGGFCDCGNKAKPAQESEAVYPPREASRSLAWGNLKFIARNPEFALTLGGPYFVTALLLLAWRGYGATGGEESYLARAMQISAAR
jgi:hypothetical protein